MKLLMELGPGLNAGGGASAIKVIGAGTTFEAMLLALLGKVSSRLLS